MSFTSKSAPPIFVPPPPPESPPPPALSESPKRETLISCESPSSVHTELNKTPEHSQGMS